MPTIFRAAAVGLVLLTATVASAQTARTGKPMREKLTHSQRILTALTTSDYALLQRESRALIAVTHSPVWTELMTAEYLPYTSGFTKALDDLAAAADRHDFDAAASSYASLTRACLDCHKHVMNSRVARSDLLPQRPESDQR